jgi:hypothetical protein
MAPSWIDLEREMKEGPFAQKGFTKQLQQQIEYKMELKQTTVKSRFIRIAGVSAVVLLLVLSLTHFDWSHITTKQTNSTPASNTEINEHKPVVSNLPFRVKSVLLLGLRTDIQGKNSSEALNANNYSTYRTQLITGDSKAKQNVLISAEGNGLLIPHGQQFWKIDALTQETPNGTNHYLSAHLASSKAITRNDAGTSTGQLHSNEKLVYAGNNYVSIISSEEGIQGNATASYQTVWTRTLEQMNTAAGKSAKDHISMNEIFGNQTDAEIAQIQPKLDSSQGGITSEITGENWTLTRQIGKWLPQIAEIETFSNPATTSFKLHSIPIEIPEKIVSHDQLVCSWDRITQMQPEAIDAVSSPDGDMVAIITVNKIYVYPYEDNQFGPLALQIELNKNESMVMAQWATAKYADKWIDEGNRYLKK